MRAGAVGLALAALAVSACASSPASVSYRPAPAILRMPPVDYGPPGDARNPPQGPFQPNAYLRACPGMRVSNAPALDADRWLTDFKPVIVAFGVILASSPVNDVCLSSGFGLRDGRMHNGIDLTSRPPGIVYSGGPGRVVEAKNSSGYGLNVVLDHGNGVYTRYAHLDYFAPGITPGVAIGFGQPVGQMGATGNAQAAHLHYEILTGNIDTIKGSFGLSPHDPLAFPPYEGALQAGY